MWTQLKFSCLLRLLGKLIKSKKKMVSAQTLSFVKNMKAKITILHGATIFFEYSSTLSEMRDAFVLMSRANL